MLEFFNYEEEAIQQIEKLQKRMISNNLEIQNLSQQQNIRAFYENGIIEQLFGENEKALKNFKQILGMEKQIIWNYFLFTNHLEYIEYYDEAINCYRTLLEKQPEADVILFILSIILKLQKKFQEAQTHIIQAFELNEKEKWYIIELGNQLEIQEQYQQAVDWYDTALDYDQNFIEAVALKCVSLLKMNQFEKAYNCLQKVKKNNFKSKLQYLLYISRTLETTNQYQTTLECYEEITNTNPQEFQIFIRQIELLIKLKRFRDAILVSNQAMTNHVQNSNNEENFNESLNISKCIQLAVQAYKQAIK